MKLTGDIEGFVNLDKCDVIASRAKFVVLVLYDDLPSSPLLRRFGNADIMSTGKHNQVVWVRSSYLACHG